MILLNSVLVAFDFSDTSMHALTYGKNLARAFGGRVHVIHVADVISTSAAQFYPDGPSEPEAKATQLGLEQLHDVLAAEGVPTAYGYVCVSASPAQAIVDHAKDIHADIIVLGTHGRTGVSRLLMGSVAETVVRTAPCPVLVVRPLEHEFVLPEPKTADVRI